MSVSIDDSQQARSRDESPSLVSIAVIGGGIAGLAAAHRLIELARRHPHACNFVLLEASDRLGGVIETRRVGEYLVEAGADAFITNKPWAAGLCGRLGLEERLISTDERFRRTLVLRKGRPFPVPEGFTLLSPAKVRPVLASPVFSLPGKLRMGLEYFLPRRKGDGDESLGAFVRRRFGREALERLVQPLVGGIYTSDPDKLGLAATLPQFLEMEREHRSLIRASRKQARGENLPGLRSGESGARYGLFATPADGLSELIEALREAVSESATIRTGTAVVKIEREVPPTLAASGAMDHQGPASSVGDSLCESSTLYEQRPGHCERPGRWSVTLEDGSTEPFNAVILALRAFRAAEIVSDCDPELAKTLGRIEYASSAVVVSGHRLADVEHPLDASGLVIPIIENRRLLAVSFASRKFPGRAPDGSVLLRTFVGGALQPEMLDHTDEELKHIVLEELRDMLGVGGTPDFVEVHRHNRAMPQYHVGHLDRVAEIESLVAGHTGLELAGNAYRGVGIPDCIHSGERAAERTWAALVSDSIRHAPDGST